MTNSNYLDFMESLNGKVKEKTVKTLGTTQEDVEVFREVYRKYPKLSQFRISNPIPVDKKNFLEKFPGIGKLLKANQVQEFIYSMYVTKGIEGAPFELIYYLEQVVEKYNTPNMLYYVLPTGIKSRMESKGYLPENINCNDIVRALFNTDSDLITKTKLLVKSIGDWYDFYCVKKDRVLMLPDVIVKQMPVSLEELQEVDLDQYGRLNLMGKDIFRSAGLRGVKESKYDFRYIY